MQAGRWNWLDDGLLPFLLAAMRATWLWSLLALLQAILAPTQRAPVLPLWLLIGIPIVSFTLTRQLLPEQPERVAPQRLTLIRHGIAASGLLVLLLVLWWHFYRDQYPLWSAQWFVLLGYDLTRWGQELPVQVLAAVTAIFLWMQGILNGRAPIYHEDVWRSFIVGAALLAFTLWLNQVSGSPAQMAGVTGVGGVAWVIIFFACGMAALAATNLKTASGWSLFGPGSGKAQVNRYWVLSITITVLGLLAIGVIIGWLVAPEDVVWLLDLGRMLLAAVGQVLYWIVLALSYVAFAIFYVIYWLIGPLIERLRDREPEEREAEVAEPFSMPEGLEMDMADPATVPEPFRWIALAVIAIVVVIAFVLLLRRLRSAPAEEPEEIRESVYSSELFEEQLGNLLQSWRNWFQRGGPAGPAYFDLTGEVDTRRRIRAVYQHLLAAAAKRGSPRPAAQTPREYQPHLQESLLPGASTLDMITEQYMQARYAPDPPSPEAAAQVQAAWEEIEERLHEDDEGRPKE
jgi:hypothetical protein